MSHLTTLQIIRLSRNHNRLHERYIEGHCPTCYGGTLDKMDMKSATPFLRSTPLKTSQTRSENKV